MGQKISEKQMKEEIRSVVRQNIKEVTTNDWHYKAIMAIWDKGGSFTRKKIGTILLKDPKADRRDVEDALRNSGYDEVTDVTDRLRIEGVITEGEDQIPGGLAKGMTLNDIAEKHGMSVDMLVAEFKKGIQTEMEHTTDREMAKEITMDHLFEDPQYYTKLATVEEYVDDKGVEHVAAALPQTEEEPIKEGEDSEETLEGLKEMAMGDLERIADYANMILERMGQGQNLDSWMYSQITLAVDQLNSVHDTMDGTDGKKEEVKEGKINEGAKRFYQLDYPNSKYVIYYYDGKTYYSDGYGGKTDAYETSGFLNKSQAEKLKKELIKKGYREDDRMRKESVNEEKVYIDYLNKQKGFKQDRIKFNSYEEAVKWAKKNFEKFNSDMIKYESINELSGNERQIKNGNPNNIFYIFYKGQFAAEYWAMNPTDLFNIYWDEFKVRRPAGSKFKLNPEFIIVPKKEYDNSTSNRYAKLKPYVDKFWDKLQNESESKNIKWQNEQIEIVLNENLDEGIVKDMILTAMIAISAIGGTAYLDHSIQRQLKAGNSVEVSMGQQIFNGNKLNKDKYILTVNPKQTQSVKIDTSKSTITLNTSDISNSKIKSAVRDQMKKIDPSLDNQKIDKGSKDAAGKIKFGYHTGVSIGQGADGNYGLRGPGYFGLGYDIGESVNEGTEPDIIAQIKDIAKKHQNNIVIDPKSGKKMRVDAFSASAIATVYDALSDSSKEKFLASGLLGMQQMAMKLLKK